MSIGSFLVSMYCLRNVERRDLEVSRESAKAPYCGKKYENPVKIQERIVKCRKECIETYFQVLRRIDKFITSQFNGSGARTYRYQKILLAFPKELLAFRRTFQNYFWLHQKMFWNH
jgi:hypothetical protein